MVDYRRFESSSTLILKIGQLGMQTWDTRALLSFCYSVITTQLSPLDRCCFLRLLRLAGGEPGVFWFSFIFTFTVSAEENSTNALPYWPMFPFVSKYFVRCKTSLIFSQLKRKEFNQKKTTKTFFVCLPRFSIFEKFQASSVSCSGIFGARKYCNNNSNNNDNVNSDNDNNETSSSNRLGKLGIHCLARKAVMEAKLCRSQVRIPLGSLIELYFLLLSTKNNFVLFCS